MRPDIRERIARAETARKAQEQAESERVRRSILMRRMEEESRKAKDDMRYGMFLMADMYAGKLEETRDMLQPKPGEAWSDEFCNVISLLPEAQMFAMDCWYDCTEVKE